MRAWIARDAEKIWGEDGGHIYMFFHEKPEKKYIRDEKGTWNNRRCDSTRLKQDELPEGLNPQWEDAEPIEVEITIKVKEI